MRLKTETFTLADTAFPLNAFGYNILTAAKEIVSIESCIVRATYGSGTKFDRGATVITNTLFDEDFQRAAANSLHVSYLGGKKIGLMRPSYSQTIDTPTNVTITVNYLTGE